MLIPRPTGSHVAGAAPKRRAPDALSLALRAGISPQQRQLDIQEIQSWFQSGSMQGGLWLPEWGYLAQDSAGTAVTTAGQVAGIWRDAARSGQFGSEKITNGDFYSGTTGWSAYLTASISEANNELVVNIQGMGGGCTQTPVSITQGRLYKLSFTCRIGTFNGTQLSLYENAGLIGQTISISGTNENYGAYFVSTGSSFTFRLTRYVGNTGTIIIDNVSLIEVLGNNGFQATTANKPLTAITPQSQKPWLNADATDVMPVVFSSALGSACTIARAQPTGVEFAESQTVNATWNDIVRPNQYNSAVLVSNRALSAYEKSVVSRALGRYVPVVLQAGTIV